MTTCSCSACSLKDVLMRQMKLALVQRHVSISPLLPAMDITCSVQGWEVSAMYCIVHMDLHPTA